MPLLRRPARARVDPLQGIVEFWRWWGEQGAVATAAALDDGDLVAWAKVLGERVDAISPGMPWELAAGTGSQHCLVVTAAGDADLRATARRWRRAAPAADEVWEFSDVRLPLASLTWSLTLPGGVVDAASVRVGVEVHGPAVDVVVHHPAFARMPEEEQGVVAFLLLDGALGEQAVETWLGDVSSSPAEPAGAVDLAALRDVVAEVEREHTTPDGEATWAVLEGQVAGRLVLAAAQVPLQPMTAPHLDTHVEVAVRYTDVDAAGLPGPDALTALRALEDHLEERLGGSGSVLAHETSAGTRRLHLYVDSTTPAVDQVRAALGGWQDGRPRVTVTADPAWDAVEHLRG